MTNRMTDSNIYTPVWKQRVIVCMAAWLDAVFGPYILLI